MALKDYRVVKVGSEDDPEIWKKRHDFRFGMSERYQSDLESSRRHAMQLANEIVSLRADRKLLGWFSLIIFLAWLFTLNFVPGR